MNNFGNKLSDALLESFKKLYDRICFRPIDVSKLTNIGHKRAMESIIFLMKKRDGRVKGQACANLSTQ